MLQVERLRRLQYNHNRQAQGSLQKTFTEGEKVRKTQVLKYFGGVEQTAAALGRTGSAVRQWPRVVSENIERLVIFEALKAARWKVEVVRRAFPATFES